MEGKFIGGNLNLRDIDRQTAFEKFLRMPLPNLKYGITMNTNVSFIDFNKIVENYDENEKTIVIEADQNVTVEEMKNETNTEFLKGFEDDKFLALHKALCNQAVFVNIPENGKYSVKINELIKNKSGFSNIFVVCGENTKATIVLDNSSEEAYYRSALVKIIAKKGSIVKIINMRDAENKTNNFEKEQIIAEKDANVKYIDVCIGSSFTKRELITKLEEEGAEIKIAGVNYGRGEQVFDIHYSVIHHAKNTTSNMLVKKVLSDKAKSVLRGLVKIEKNCSGSQGYQKEDTLLLSETAETNLFPKLEIDNNDVKCSHGSTVTHLDEEKMFYLMSRGLDEKEAKNKIVEGFVSVILDEAMEIKQNVMRKISL